MVEEIIMTPKDSMSNDDSSMRQMKKHGREERKSTGHGADMLMMCMSEDSVNRQDEVSDLSAASNSEGA